MPSAYSPRVRVLSYNIKGWSGGTAALSAAVRELGPDVVVVQEALRWSDPRTWLVDLAGRLGMARAYGGLTACGNAVLTSAAVTVHGGRTVRYPLTWTDSPRAAVLVRCSVRGVTFAAAGSHLSTDAAIRVQQATIFKNLLASAGAPVVVGIDLNETSTGRAWQIIASGLVDAAEKAGQADVPTFSTSRPVRRIDAVLADPTLSVSDYGVVDTPRTRAASDHFPLLAEVGLPRG